MSLNETPNSNRLHIGFFGRTNSGKSSLINAFTGQKVSIVADVSGTTTDPVYKPMEISPLGPCVIIDTAGFGDESVLGGSRAEKTLLAAEKTEIAVIVITPERHSQGFPDFFPEEYEWYQRFKEKNTPVLFLVNKADIYPEAEALLEEIKQTVKEEALAVSALTGEGIQQIKEALTRLLPEDHGEQTITGDLVAEGDLVLLVMPQDIQAPKGRLILPQVQTLRELLDKKCLVMSVTTDKLAAALSHLTKPPKLIVTDSQVFDHVYAHKPAESMLTSFSVLFAAYKGDISYYIQGAKAIDSLTNSSKVLIAECCTHAPLSEDIGRVKIPWLLRKRFGEGLQVTLVSGMDFPQELLSYDLIIQCGACMFNRKYVLSRIDRAKKQGVPMTNYGITIAHLTGILDQVAVPFV